MSDQVTKLAAPQDVGGAVIRLGRARVIQGLAQRAQRQVGFLRKEERALFERAGDLAFNEGPQAGNRAQQRCLADAGLAANQQGRGLRDGEVEVFQQEGAGRRSHGQRRNGKLAAALLDLCSWKVFDGIHRIEKTGKPVDDGTVAGEIVVGTAEK